MAMSRSFGGTSLTTSPPIMMSPPVMSSRPAIIRSVVDLPQPEGPTSTTNSWSAMSRSMPRTASTSSYFLTTLRNVTSAMSSTLCRAGGQAGNVIVHQERVDDQRRCGAEQGAGHDLPPVEHVALDQRGDDADRQHQLVCRGREHQWIEELRPGNRESEDGRCDDARHRHRNENARKRLKPRRPVDNGGLVKLLWDRGEISDHDPGAERHRQRRIDKQQDVPSVDQLNSGPVAEQYEYLEQGNEQQAVRNQISQEYAGRERRRTPEPHPRQRECRRHADQHRDGDHKD